MESKICKQCRERFLPNYRSSQRFCNEKCQTKFWYLNNKKHRREYRRQWYLKNRKRILEQAKEYAEKNQEKIQNYKQSLWGSYRKYLGYQQDKTSLSFEDFKKIKERDKICAYCNSKIANSIDHIIPRKKGEKTSFYNLIGSCNICNSSKGSLGIFEWSQTDYCKENNINLNTINPVVLNSLGGLK